MPIRQPHGTGDRSVAALGKPICYYLYRSIGHHPVNCPLWPPPEA